MFKPILTTVFMWSMCCISAALAQSGYSNHAQLTVRLTDLSTKNAAIANVKSIGKSRGGRDIWLLTLSKGNAAKKPALLIVGGIDGSHIAGSELVTQMVEKLTTSVGTDSIAKLLETKTLYFIPSVNPDAQEQVAAKVKFERSGNDASTDDDRDGRFNEDPFEDLNTDGIISTLRIEDPTGTMIASKDDPRILVKADPAKGETGKYLVISEGLDNDKDGNYNEDGPGGVNIDKNFTFDYPIFVAGSGEYATSEPEARALLDFLYTSPNIFAVLIFGPNNNLSEATRFDPSKMVTRIIKGPTAKDAAVGEQVSKLYNATGLKDAPTMPQSRGNFSQSAYYHAGRFSFSTPGWWPAKVEAPRDSSRRGGAAPTPPTNTGATPNPAGAMRSGGGIAAGAGRGAGMMGGAAAPAAANAGGVDDATFLKWADKEKITGSFVNWTPIEHPDFAGKKVEIGGIAPYAKLNPPVSYLTEAAAKHLSFVVGLGKQMPNIEIVNIKTESLGAGLSRVTATVINKGLMPTYADIGDRVRFVQKMRTEIKLSAGQTIVSGRRLNLRQSLGAGEKEEYSWLVAGAGTATIEAGCATAGIKSVEVTVK
jgi:Zinc carboxypeptidase